MTKIAINPSDLHITKESTQSAVSWAAVIVGAVAACAVSIVLFALGAGIGFSAVSPWTRPESVMVFTISTAIWLIVMQWAASLVGGYLTGRLRTKWTGLHTREVFFRDVAHGFMAWALATVITVGLFASGASAVVSGGVKAASSMAAARMQEPMPMPGMDPNLYFAESLYRTTDTSMTADSRNIQEETRRIFAYGMKNGTVTEEDKAYLAARVTSLTGLSSADARARVDATIERAELAAEKAKEAADKARKAGRNFAFFTFFSMVIGAFIASVAAALGGRLRDEY